MIVKLQTSFVVPADAATTCNELSSLQLATFRQAVDVKLSDEIAVGKVQTFAQRVEATR